MKGAIWLKLDWLARMLVPVSLAAAMLALGAVPLPLPHFHSLGLGLALIAVYYWAIHAPRLLNAPMAFAIGLVGDFLGAAPLGVGALTLLAVHAVVESQRRLLLGAPFLMVWWGYMVVGAAANLGLWLMVSLNVGTLIDPTPALFGYLWSLCVYPAVAFVMAMAQRALPQEAA